MNTKSSTSGTTPGRASATSEASWTKVTPSNAIPRAAQ
jgi:hypothetical protein